MAISLAEHNVRWGVLGKLSVMWQIYTGNGIAHTMKHAPDVCLLLIQKPLKITENVK